MRFYACFESTYKELKQLQEQEVEVYKDVLESTHKELKPYDNEYVWFGRK